MEISYGFIVAGNVLYRMNYTTGETWIVNAAWPPSWIKIREQKTEGQF